MALTRYIRLGTDAKKFRELRENTIRQIGDTKKKMTRDGQQNMKLVGGAKK